MKTDTVAPAFVEVLESREAGARNFVSFGRGSFRSERAAITAARGKLRGGEANAVVVHVPGDRLHEESWLGG